MAYASSESLNSGFNPDATLMESLRASARRGRGALVYVRHDGTEVRQTYAELLESALRVGRGLRAAKIEKGTPILLQLELSEDFLPGFWGCIAAGAIPVPCAVGPTFTQPNSALLKLVNAGKLFDYVPVLATGTALAGLRALPKSLGTLAGPVLDLRELAIAGAVGEPLPEPVPTDVAVLLLTSGSTGIPKGVPLMHRNLLAMAAGSVQDIGFTPDDVSLNWMALDHAGAVSFLGTMITHIGCTQIHVPTNYILTDPLRWLDLIDKHRATMSWAPNFAFTLFLDRAAAVEKGSWDLSSMRFLVNAGESVVARTARRFISLLEKHGLPKGALRPAFGMSETCSGITWSRGFTLENSSDDQPFVDLGPTIPGAEMRIVNDKGELLAEGESGLFQLKGPSVFSGYYHNPKINAEVMHDGWYTTGDLAFIKDGRLYITGRKKDVIIVNGANFYCHEIEDVAESVPGTIKTFTAAVGVRDPGANTDQLALFFCPDTEDPAAIATMARAIRGKLIQEAGIAPAYLIRMYPREMPKTEIQKIQRTHLRHEYEAGNLKDRIVPLGRHAAHAPHTAQVKPKASRNELAQAISEIWQDVLGVDSVGYDETFFELGGHSLLVIQVQSRLQQLIGRTIPVVELFECPTVRTMAEHFAKDLGAPDDASVTKQATAASGDAASRSRDIAIIGLGVRFPGASTPEAFWKVLDEGRETIRTFTREEALAAGVDPELVRNPHYVRSAPMLDNPEAFDAEFFKYTAKEARMTDPQQRIFLEVCWEAFEDAGYDPLTFAGKVGLFASAGLNTYLANHLLANRQFLQEENGGRMLTVDSMSGFNIMITNDKDYLPTRVSYKLNLRGPSINVQTACSSTLMTLHEACNSLLLGDCEMALAGGSSIKLPQHAGHLYSAGMLNSPDGHCRAYDAKAEGTIFGNGAGVVLLKPLAAAVSDGDHIYAVVKATAANNDGAGKVGYTAPSAAGEEGVCAEALARAGVRAETITFVEGHGTGTPLGDPIEVNALTSAFRRETHRSGFCALGSVKTNVGHLQIASGIAGLIKTTLALHHKRIPATLHYEKPNPRIDFPNTPFYVNRETIAWDTAAGAPRRAGVNSLGIGGSNVHAILEEAPAPTPAGAANAQRVVLPLSARTPAALRQLAARYATLLASDSAPTLGDAVYTAQVGRARMTERAAFVATSCDDLARHLTAFSATPAVAGQRIDFEKQGLAFVFGESTAPEVSACEHEPVFRAAIERCAAVIAAELGKPADEILAGKSEAARRLAAFVQQVALTELLASYGIEPVTVVGRGVGELAAACCAGVFSVEDALRLVVAQGRGDDELGVVAPTVALSAPRRKLISGRTGLPLQENDVVTTGYWVALLRHEPNAAGTEPRVSEIPFAVEIGASTRPIVGADARRVSAGDFPALLAALFSAGFAVDWAAGRRATPARRVSLPTYPWQRSTYWIEGTDLRQPLAGTAGVAADVDPLLGRRWKSPRVRETVYESQLNVDALPYLAEHRVHGRIVVPGALYLSQVARQAADLLTSSRGGSQAARSIALTDVAFVRPLVIDPAAPRTVQTIFTPDDSGAQRFEVVSFPPDQVDEVVVHASGRASRTSESATPAKVVELNAGLNQPQTGASHYAVMDAMGVALGTSFRWVRECRAGNGRSVASLEAPASLKAVRDWHPGLVDSMLQAAVPAARLDGSRSLIPFRVRRYVVHGNPDGGILTAAARQATAEGGSVRCDIRLYDAAGAALIEVDGFELREIAAEDVAAAAGMSGAECFEIAWEPLAQPAGSEAAREAGAWLLLADDLPATRSLQWALEAAGAKVTVVSSREKERALAALQTAAWRGVVCAWPLTAERPEQVCWPELLACVRAAATNAHPARWVFLSAADSRFPAQASLAGFALGLSHEFPEWRALHVEIDPASRHVALLVPWLLDNTSTERRLALRDAVVDGARLSTTRTLTNEAAQVVVDGSYLVTGGAGALGLTVADWLVGKGARNVVLCGRSAPTPELRARLETWKSKGAHVTYEKADVASPEDVRRVVSRAERLGALRGIFHAAGQLHDGFLRNADPETFCAAFDAKITGACNLHEASCGRKLDWFVLFSSIASVLGSAGQANYAAGNAFLDGLARWRRQQGLPALSVQWGPWAEIGMTARLAERDRLRLAERGLVPLRPADALRTLEQLLGGAPACVAVFAWDRRKYGASLGAQPEAFYGRVLAGEAAEIPSEQTERGDFGSMPLPARTEALEKLIRESIASILGFDSYLKVEREKGLFDLGIDSLTAVDLKMRLEKALGTTLRTTIAFDHPTAADMAAYLAGSLFPAEQATPAAPIGARAKPNKDNTVKLGDLTEADLEALLKEELKD